MSRFLSKFSFLKIITTNQFPNYADAAADFEAAISATGYGKFNILFLPAVFPCCLMPYFETSTTAYVIPFAQCDLNLTLEDKGVIMASNFGGELTTTYIFIWILLVCNYSLP